MKKIEEIVEKLKSGIAVKTLLEEGYTKSTVYKAKRKLEGKKEKGDTVNGSKSEKLDNPETPDDENTKKNIIPDTDSGSDGVHSLPDNENNMENNKKPPEDNGLMGDVIFFRNPDSGNVGDNVEKRNIPIHYEDENETGEKETGTGKYKLSSDFRISDGISNIFSLIALVRNKKYWTLDDSEKKEIKKICPSIAKYDKLAGLFAKYSCTISLIVILLKRLKLEIEDKKKIVNIEQIPERSIEEIEMENGAIPTVRSE